MVHRHVLAALFPLALLAARVAADDVPPRSISTTGESVIYVTPDDVQVNFGIETFDADLDSAKSLNDDRGGQLVAAVKGLGIDPKYIQTDNLEIEIQYRSNRAWEGIAGYFARRAYSVKLKDAKQFEKLIDAGLKNGANQLLGFNFRTTQLRKYRDQARKMAIKAAKEKAIDLATELDCGVGKPRTINEGYAGSFGNYAWRYNNQIMQNSVQEAPAPAAGDQDETLPLGQIGIRAQVSVTFDLTDAPASSRGPNDGHSTPAEK
jgi:uncharacterized protein YggE